MSADPEGFPNMEQHFQERVPILQEEAHARAHDDAPHSHADGSRLIDSSTGEGLKCQEIM